MSALDECIECARRQGLGRPQDKQGVADEAAEELKALLYVLELLVEDTERMMKLIGGNMDEREHVERARAIIKEQRWRAMSKSTDSCLHENVQQISGLCYGCGKIVPFSPRR